MPQIHPLHKQLAAPLQLTHLQHTSPHVRAPHRPHAPDLSNGSSRHSASNNFVPCIPTSSPSTVLRLSQPTTNIVHSPSVRSSDSTMPSHATHQQGHSLPPRPPVIVTPSTSDPFSSAKQSQRQSREISATYITAAQSNSIEEQESDISPAERNIRENTAWKRILQTT